MSLVRSRPLWQRVVLIILSAGILTVIIQFFHDDRLIQSLIFALLSLGLSVTARWEETRYSILARFFLGLFLFSAFLVTVADVHLAWIPALIFGLLTALFVFLGAVNEDPLGVDKDRRESQ